MEKLYQAFLTHVFDHPETEEAWFWDIDAPEFKEGPETIAKLVSLVFRRSGSDLQRFSDRQVSDGLKYILDSACNDISYIIRDGDFPMDVKLDVIRSMWSLYTDCFAKRCPPVLGHRSEPSKSELSYICYMLWDVTGLAYWPDAGKVEAYRAITRLLDDVLYLDNEACIESALHGLGHIHTYSPDIVEEIVERFMTKRKDVRAQLYEYAKAAKVGYVL